MENSLRIQRGVSLIGILIGLFVSMLTVLVCMTLFKNLIQVSAESSFEESHDGKLASALLAIQMEVTSAGFGLDPGVHVAVVPPNADGVTKLLWRTKDSGSVKCWLLREEKETPQSGSVLAHLWLRDKTCSEGDDLSTLGGFGSGGVLLGTWPIQTKKFKDHITAHKTLFNFAINTTASCAPFGAYDPKSGYSVTVEVANFSQLHLDNDAHSPNSYEFCLVNMTS